MRVLVPYYGAVKCKRAVRVFTGSSPNIVPVAEEYIVKVQIVIGIAHSVPGHIVGVAVRVNHYVHMLVYISRQSAGGRRVRHVELPEIMMHLVEMIESVRFVHRRDSAVTEPRIHIEKSVVVNSRA